MLLCALSKYTIPEIILYTTAPSFMVRGNKYNLVLVALDTTSHSSIEIHSIILSLGNTIYGIKLLRGKVFVIKPHELYKK